MQEPDQADTNYTQGWFQQKLDHFGGGSFFMQRYWINEQYFDKDTGPVFLKVCGEGECKTSNDSYPVPAFAIEQKSLMFALEHRYYGNSQPRGDWSTSNLKYLSSR